jgi:membrane associated rhomboid family serine protease
MDFRPSRFEILPVVVKNLLIINGLFFLATIVFGRQGIDLANYLALHHWSSTQFKIWQLLTHLFMHGDVGGVGANYEAGFMHLFSNMFALWMFGSVLENVFGPKRFLYFYLMCGIGASLLHLGVVSWQLSQVQDLITAFQNRPTLNAYSTYLSKHSISPNSSFGILVYDIKQQWQAAQGTTQVTFLQSISFELNRYLEMMKDTPTVGASGAVFGILFAFGYLFPNTELYLYFIPIPIKAKYFVALYALFELYSGFRNSATDNIAHFAHLGGMLVAFLILKVWNKTHRKNFF